MTERVVIWDDQCGFCAACVAWLRRLDWRHRLRFEGASNAKLLASLGISAEEADAGLQYVGGAERRSGYDAVVAALDALPLTFLVAPLLRTPPIRSIGHRIYERVARNRHCLLPSGK